MKCYSSSSPRPAKSLRNAIRYNCKKICSLSRRPKTIMEIRKKATFLQVIKNSIIYKFFKGFPKHRKKTNKAVVFSYRPFLNICKYRGPPMRPSNNQENKTPSDTCQRVQLVYTTFFTILGVTEICSFRLVTEGKTGKDIPDSPRLEFLQNFSAILLYQMQKKTPQGHWIEEV